jgi:prepilin-type N-terminal cleavage/methylation domain-containing protein
MKKESGVTLIELLAALLISSLVIVLATRIFLSGNRQFLNRALESDRLAALYKLKGAVQHALQGEIGRCESGKIWLRGDGKEQEVFASLRSRFPNVRVADFRCWEKSGEPISLVPWKDWFQPALIEYQIVVATSGTKDTLSGSWLK